MTTITGHTTRAAGTVLTAAIYNTDHVNHVTNATNLNSTKLEGAAGPVVDGHGVIFNGTSGAALRTLAAAPVPDTRQITAGTGLTGGGNLQADRTLSLADDGVTNAKLANMATATFKARNTAGTGDPEDITVAQATALLNAVVGDAGSGGTKGLVPAPAAGDAAANKFLKASGAWATVVTTDVRVGASASASVTGNGTDTVSISTAAGNFLKSFSLATNFPVDAHTISGTQRPIQKDVGGGFVTVSEI